MDCNKVKSLLSAYYDQELSADIRSQVALHLAACEDCAAELAGFGELSAMAKNLRQPLPPAQMWDGLEAQLNTTTDSHAATLQFRGSLKWMRQPVARFALAAAALVLIVIGCFAFKASNHNDEHEMTAVFEKYLDQFSSDPHAADAILLANYEGRAVAPDQAIHLVGYLPLVADGLPPGYSVVSTHVMKMPCCTCVKCLCQRDDGTAIAIIEHDDKEPDWFGDRANREAVCNGTRCSLVELDGRLAATWRRGSRHISVIGARDVTEVSQLVAWFDDRRKRLPN